MLQNLCLPFGPFSINPLQRMRSHQECPIPFPCAFSFLILQYALRWGGGRQKNKNKKIGAASNQGHQFSFFVDPPPSGKLCAVHVGDAGDTAMSMRCLLL